MCSVGRRGDLDCILWERVGLVDSPFLHVPLFTPTPTNPRLFQSTSALHDQGTK